MSGPLKIHSVKERLAQSSHQLYHLDKYKFSQRNYQNRRYHNTKKSVRLTESSIQKEAGRL